MPRNKSIVCVSASFAKGRELQAMLSKYAQFSDERFAYWGSFAFTAELLPSCDAVLVFNYPATMFETVTDPGRVIAFMMEPGEPGEHPWMFRRLEQYARVYSPVPGSNVVSSHGYLGWYPDRNYQSLKALPAPAKDRIISCIVSGLNRLPGHRERLAFTKELVKRVPAVDLFGRHDRFLPDKMEGLLPFRYSIAMENSSRPHYFTEKINDCFLAWTVPVYFGCTNIGAYFPERSFIRIDIRDTETAIRKIEDLIENDNWESRLPAIEEARNLVLEMYHPLAGAAALLREIPVAPKQAIQLKPVRRLFPDRIRSAWQLAFPKSKLIPAPSAPGWQST